MCSIIRTLVNVKLGESATDTHTHTYIGRETGTVAGVVAGVLLSYHYATSLFSISNSLSATRKERQRDHIRLLSCDLSGFFQSYFLYYKKQRGSYCTAPTTLLPFMSFRSLKTPK